MVDVISLSQDQTRTLLNWAQSEGWNPGLEDAEAFYSTDPSGFFGLKVNGELASGMSLVKHNENYAFLGLYISQPQFRGLGLGFTLWQAALDGKEAISIGLDGVVEQQANYQKSGFSFAWKNTRYRVLATKSPPKQTDISGSLEHDKLEVRPIDSELVQPTIDFDATIGGFSRPAFLHNWFKQTKSRLTLVARHQNTVCGVVTIRKCTEDYKVGPLLADSQNIAEVLLHQAVKHIGADQYYIDIPDSNDSANAMVKQLGCQPVFETARMYRGSAPVCMKEKLFGIATLELG